MVRKYLIGILFLVVGVPGAAQEMKILREMDRDPMVSAAVGDLLPQPAGDIGPVMKSTPPREKETLKNEKVEETDKSVFVPAEDTGKTRVVERTKKSVGEGDSDPSIKTLYTLGLIDGEIDESSTVITIRLNKKIDWKEVALENHNTYLQIPLPRTIVPDSGKFIDIKGPYVTKVASFQVTPERGAVRLFLSRDFPTLESGLHADILGDRIVVTIDHNVLAKIGVLDHLPQNNVKGSPQVADIIAKTQVRSDIPDPAAGIKPEPESQGKGVISSDNLQQKTKLVAVFSAIIFVGFIGLSLMRSLFLRLRNSSGQENEYIMKTIASSHLAPKHKLTLMQIGNERILLSVSPDGIKYLTTINTNDLKGQALQAAPVVDNTPVRYQEAMTKKPLLAAAAQNYKGVSTMTRNSGTVPTDPIPGRRPAPTPKEESNLTLDGRAGKGRRVNAVISDEGVRDMRSVYQNADSLDFGHASKAIEDVTTLIRKKIKNLPTL